MDFLRNQNHSYAVCETTEREVHHYEMKMLMNRELESVFRMEVRRLDDLIRCCYDITGWKSMAVIFERNSISGNDLRGLIKKMDETQKELENFMLPMEGIVLDPEQIYYSLEKNCWKFCFDPGKRENLSEKMTVLFQFVLDHIDYQDSLGVTLAYGIFQECRKKDAGIQNLLEILKEGEEKEQKEINENEKMEKSQGQKNYEDFENTDRGVVKENILYPLAIRKQEKTEGEKGKTSWFERWKIKLFSSGKETKEKKTEISSFYEEENWMDDGSFVNLGKEDKNGLGTEKGISENEYFEKNEKNGKRRITERLSRSADKNESAFRLILCADSTEKRKEAVLDEFPYLVGKAEGNADLCLESSFVSRYHARFTIDEGTLFIEDLNSSNGSYINDSLLCANRKYNLKNGDVLGFADQRYRLYCQNKRNAMEEEVRTEGK